jgi:chromosome segregation ATPase
MSDKTSETKEAKGPERSEAEVRASALAGEVDQLKADLAAARKAAASADEQLRAANDRARAAERAAAEAQGRLADLEAGCQVLVLARDAIVSGVPKAVGTRLACVHTEPGVELVWLAEALSRGTVRAK